MRLLDLLRRQFTLVHVSGIPVRADYRWFLVISLMAAVVAGSIGGANPAASVLLGLATTLVFFGSIFVHEFAHAVVARMERLDVLEIVLHPFGGLTRFRSQPDTPRAEFRVAIAGPAASFLLSLLFVLGAAAAGGAGADILAGLLFTLALGNFLIAVFNMFPGYPLDGGRVLRAYLWRSGKDLNQATILTGRCGQAIAVVMFVFGLYVALVRRDFFTGFWAILVGLFLFDSAAGIIREVNAMEHIAVEDVMMLPVSVSPAASIQEFVDSILPMYRQDVFPVANERQLFGMLLLADLKMVDRGHWHAKRVGDMMRPVAGDHFIEVGSSLAEARETIRANGIGAVAVVDGEGYLVGVVHAVKR